MFNTQTLPFNAKTTTYGKLTKVKNSCKYTNIYKPPFNIAGVDCFGPVAIKQYKQTRTSNNNKIKR